MLLNKLLLSSLLVLTIGTLSCAKIKVSQPISLTEETIVWEASVLSDSGKDVIASGVKTYSPDTDIEIHKATAPDGSFFWRKGLSLDDTFAINAPVFRVPRLEGFGLVIQMRNHGGFSWEWFDLVEGNIYKKLQGEGTVSVTLNRGSDLEELNSVEFLDDIILRYQDDMSKPPGNISHVIVIKKGSVLRLGPDPKGGLIVEQMSFKQFAPYWFI